ncbi:MAG: hypothetical protein IPM07_21535 [Anaerolineales bacterium]|nr:hypothetical protein [Anaerolineales bacterium]
MQTIARSSFTTVKTEGGLLPADLLQRIADGRAVEGLRPEDYHLLPGERLNEAINRAWNRCLGAWLSFDDQRRKLPETDTGTTLTRERWLLVLFQELGYGRLQLQRGGLQSDDGTTYPVSHVWEQTPIHLVTFRQALDQRSAVATQLKRSPHSMMQELLNRSRRYTWGLISNGLQLRILRDNASLRRAAYVEFDLESMMSGELYAEFALLWLACHQSRVERLGDLETGRLEFGDERDLRAEDDEVGSDDTQSPISQSRYRFFLARTLVQTCRRAGDAGHGRAARGRGRGDYGAGQWFRGARGQPDAADTAAKWRAEHAGLLPATAAAGLPADLSLCGRRARPAPAARCDAGDAPAL